MENPYPPTASPVSLTTLSYWRSGDRHPEGAGSYAAIREIENLLGIQEDALVSKIGPHRRVGPLAAAVAPFEARSVNEAAEETTAALGVHAWPVPPGWGAAALGAVPP